MALIKLPITGLAAAALLAVSLVAIARGVKMQQLSCLDDDGSPVDWFIAYKFPRLKAEGLPYSTGYAYAYMTSRTTDGSTIWGTKKGGGGKKIRAPSANWVISDKLTTDPESMILRTLAFAYGDSWLGTRPSTVMYNDAPPNQDHGNSNRAHAKGVLMVDDENGDGIWLPHSVPNFPPPLGERLKYQELSRHFGQLFMCISFNFATAGEKIVDHLVNMRPVVYDSRLSYGLVEAVPAISYLEPKVKMRPRRKSDIDTAYLSQIIQTRDGQTIELFSKSGQIKEDIYSGWLDAELESNLYVLSWRRGSGNLLGSTCPSNDYHVNNVDEVRINAGGSDVSWTSTHDHSKWAISQDASSSIVCMSDVNRAESQFSRGGGSVCMHCPACWQIFSNSIQQLEPCPKNKQ